MEQDGIELKMPRSLHLNYGKRFSFGEKLQKGFLYKDINTASLEMK